MGTVLLNEVGAVVTGSVCMYYFEHYTSYYSNFACVFGSKPLLYAAMCLSSLSKMQTADINQFRCCKNVAPASLMHYTADSCLLSLIVTCFGAVCR